MGVLTERCRDGAASILDRRALLGQVVEHYADDALVTITGVEENRETGAQLRIVGCFRLGGPEETRWVVPGALLSPSTGWRVLGDAGELMELVHPVGWRSCLRCGRINAGPCTSLTCLDLRVVAG